MNTNFQKISVLAKSNGAEQTAEAFSDLYEVIETNKMKNYAVLGNVNSGKSTLINCLMGEKAAPVSIIADCHDRVLHIPDPENDRNWIEIQNAVYSDTDADEPDNALWGIDAAVYILSALAPLSAEDVTAIKACVSHGVPCVLAIGKLDLLAPEEKDSLLASTKAQLTHHFGSDDLIRLDRSQPQAVKAAVEQELSRCEDSRDTRLYLLTAAFAKTVRAKISAAFNACKAEADAAMDARKSLAAKKEKEQILWETIETQMMDQKVKLQRDVQSTAYDLYGRASAALIESARHASSLQTWWGTQLENQMRQQSKWIADKLNLLISQRFSEDRIFLIREVEKKFGIDLNIPVGSAHGAPKTVTPASVHTTNAAKRKQAALSGLGVSAVALIGSLLLPVSIPAIVLGVMTCTATLGTGFWAFLETKKDAEEKERIVHNEISKYVAECRDATIANLDQEISYLYENMTISLKDKQIASQIKDNMGADKTVSENLTRLHTEFEQINAIINELLFTDDGEED